MKENLAVELNRIVIGLILIISISLSYFFELDKILFSIIAIFIIYDLLTSKIVKINLIIISILLIFIFYFIFPLNYLFELNILLSFIFVSLLFLSIYVQKKLNYFFLILLLFLYFLLTLILKDRNIFYLIIYLSFFNDTFAYIFGKYFKGPKIAPSISPNKTWSGTICSFLLTSTLLIYLNYEILFSIIISMSFYFGDLFFSYLKRSFNIKDFSRILIGHGGILDRLDSTLFVTFFFYILVNFLQ